MNKGALIMKPKQRITTNTSFTMEHNLWWASCILSEVTGSSKAFFYNNWIRKGLIQEMESNSQFKELLEKKGIKLIIE